MGLRTASVAGLRSTESTRACRRQFPDRCIIIIDVLLAFSTIRITLQTHLDLVIAWVGLVEDHPAKIDRASMLPVVPCRVCGVALELNEWTLAWIHGISVGLLGVSVVLDGAWGVWEAEASKPS